MLMCMLLVLLGILMIMRGLGMVRVLQKTLPISGKAWAAAAAVLVCMLCITGCSSSGGSAAASGPTPSPEIITRSPSEKLASSFRDWIEFTLDYAKGSGGGSDRQIAILERAAQSGKISVSDYEQAWSNYKQCVVDKGQPEPQLDRYSNGLYQQRGLRGSERKAGAFYAASVPCHTAEVLYVTMVYNVQVDNPNLYADPYMQFVDCLHRAEAVPKSYTADDYRRERGTHEFSYDTRAPAVRSCEAASNMAVGYQDDPVQDLGW